MPKTLCFPECQPTADRLAYFLANLSHFSPLPLKPNNLDFTTIKSIFRVRSLSLTMNFTCKTVAIIFQRTILRFHLVSEDFFSLGQAQGC